MIATHGTVARPASVSDAAAAIFAVLGLIDVALTGVIGSSRRTAADRQPGRSRTRTHHAAIPGARPAWQPRGADRDRGDPGHLGSARRARVLPERAGVGHDRRGIGHRRHDHRPGPGAPAEPTARMSTASPRRAPTATWPRPARPAPLARAVRTVDRWGLLPAWPGSMAMSCFWFCSPHQSMALGHGPGQPATPSGSCRRSP